MRIITKNHKFPVKPQCPVNLIMMFVIKKQIDKNFSYSNIRSHFLLINV